MSDLHDDDIVLFGDGFGHDLPAAPPFLGRLRTMLYVKLNSGYKSHELCVRMSHQTAKRLTSEETGKDDNPEFASLFGVPVVYDDSLPFGEFEVDTVAHRNIYRGEVSAMAIPHPERVLLWWPQEGQSVPVPFEYTIQVDANGQPTHLLLTLKGGETAALVHNLETGEDVHLSIVSVEPVIVRYGDEVVMP